MSELGRPPQPVLSSQNVGQSLSKNGQNVSRNRERSAIKSEAAGLRQPLPAHLYAHLSLLKLSPFEQATRGGWRFGTRRIRDSVVTRLIASGRAEIVGGRLQLKQKPPL
ncbi:hypothetical protein I3J27_21595 [Bradyrhizobium xenonodulans]|uniref:Transposase n=1 Tax=Bradyrhizobium xenonodulans TaxID=2736875 RepID=A0ABY7MBG1_9BRAD|nr:hypothetical protein [Bradyrhizobium xenonodulans]WBL75630.1 hypothetical protein I3J27_21595 [Bradyrhizobium xenonodulans]